MTDDPIKAAFAANPDHQLVKALREGIIDGVMLAREDGRGVTNIVRAYTDCVPQPTFGERVLAHLPEGRWKNTDQGLNRCEGWWKFEGVALQSSPDEEGYWVRESSDHAAVADALLLLAGEKR